MEMNVEQQQQKPHEATTILNLPAELIVQICSYDVMDTADILNLATSHSMLNDCLFGRKNSSLWKTKYTQKYYDWNKNEFELVINEHNTWKSELMTRMHFNVAVSNAVKKLRTNLMFYQMLPSNMYPLDNELTVNNQTRQYYVLHAAVDFYKRIVSSQCEMPNLNDLYTGREFLKYICHKYFGNNIRNFFNLPLAEQTMERGFYFVSRWWYPTHDLLYCDQSRDLDALTFKVCSHLRSAYPHHPMFTNGCDLNTMIRNGQSAIDRDLYKKSDAMNILTCISYVLFCNMKMLCYCSRNLNCYLLNRVLINGKGSIFAMALVYESIARRLGILITLVPSFYKIRMFWASSWAGNSDVNQTGYFIDIVKEGKICPVQNYVLAENLLDRTNSFLDLFGLCGRLIEQSFIEKKSMHKDIYDFRKLSKTNYVAFEFLNRILNLNIPYCHCPLFLVPLNSTTLTIFRNKRFSLYSKYKEIFPTIPNRRSVNNDPEYSIGMMVDVVCDFDSDKTEFIKRGIIVGWKNVKNQEMLNSTNYYILILSRYCYSMSCKQYPDIEIATEDEEEVLIRQTTLYKYNLYPVGKFFKRYDSKLCAFVPTDELASYYPDDHVNTVNKMVDIVDTDK